MATEIELKAHVRNPESLRWILAGKAEYLYSFEKEDRYWFPSEVPPPDSSTSPLHRSGLRIRNERRAFPDGRVESSTTATCKAKEVRGGIEINDEKEFTVTPRADFEGFLALAGLKPGAAKQKRGWAYSSGKITAELLEVPGLGWFLELEIVIRVVREPPGSVGLKVRQPPLDDAASGDGVGDTDADGIVLRGAATRSGGINAESARGISEANTDAVFAEAKTRLLDFLRALGIADDDIESRFYSEMLKEGEFREPQR